MCLMNRAAHGVDIGYMIHQTLPHNDEFKLGMRGACCLCRSDLTLLHATHADFGITGMDRSVGAVFDEKR